MNIHEANEIVRNGEPDDLDLVTHVCPSCGSEWCDSRYIDSTYALQNIEYKRYVGNDHKDMKWDGEGEFAFGYILTCPNKCADSFGNISELDDIHELGLLNNFDKWECANLIVKWHSLQEDIDFKKI